MNTLFWFQNDLRLSDNEALAKAIKHTKGAGDLLLLFCFDPRKFERQSPLGVPKTGSFRFQFLLESVESLAQQIQKIGGTLVFRVGKPEEIIPALVEQYGIKGVFASKEVTDEETKVEKALARRLQLLNVPLELSWQQTLVHLHDLYFPIEELPDVFTHFRKKVEKGGLEVRELWDKPTRLSTRQAVPSDPLPTAETFGIEALKPSSKGVLHFRGGSQAAWERLNDYFWTGDHLKVYKETRNGLLGADYSSKFSPWLAFGCISPREIWYEIQNYERQRVKNQSTYWLIFELLWRDYFKLVGQKFGNQIFQFEGIRKERKKLRNDEKLFWKWANGQTGNPFVDANMRELNQTGFMSNRGRQNVASFLVKDLYVNWQWGADYFESLLIDYDPTSNWGNWCYVAGVGNDPRNDRYFNTRGQAERYDAKGEYIKTWLPELKEIPPRYVHWPAELHPKQQREFGFSLGANYPHPIVKVREPRRK